MNADQLFNTGLRSARAGDYYGAVINLRLAASLGEESAELHRLMGKAHVHLGELDQAEDSFRRALTLDSHDGGAALCLATLHKYRILRRAASATGIVAAAAAALLIFWFPWRAYRRLDASVAAISALSASRTAAGPSESAVPAASRAETLPPAASQPSAATPSSRATRALATSPPTQTQSRPATPASPAAAEISTAPPQTRSPASPRISTPPPTQTRPPAVKPAAPQIPTPRPIPMQPNGATPLFLRQYKEAVGVAFKGDLKQALVLLSALAGDEYASQPLAGNVHFWMGRCLYELNQPGEARDHFRLVIDRYPNSPKYGEALVDLGRCERKLQTPTAKPPKRRAFNSPGSRPEIDYLMALGPAPCRIEMRTAKTAFFAAEDNIPTVTFLRNERGVVDQIELMGRTARRSQ